MIVNAQTLASPDGASCCVWLHQSGTPGPTGGTS